MVKSINTSISFPDIEIGDSPLTPFRSKDYPGSPMRKRQRRFDPDPYSPLRSDVIGRIDGGFSYGGKQQQSDHKSDWKVNFELPVYSKKDMAFGYLNKKQNKNSKRINSINSPNNLRNRNSQNNPRNSPNTDEYFKNSPTRRRHRPISVSTSICQSPMSVATSICKSPLSIPTSLCKTPYSDSESSCFSPINENVDIIDMDQPTIKETRNDSSVDCETPFCVTKKDIAIGLLTKKKLAKLHRKIHKMKKENNPHPHYLTKNESPEALVSIISRCLHGKRILEPEFDIYNDIFREEKESFVAYPPTLLIQRFKPALFEKKPRKDFNCNRLFSRKPTTKGYKKSKKKHWRAPSIPPIPARSTIATPVQQNHPTSSLETSFGIYHTPKRSMERWRLDHLANKRIIKAPSEKEYLERIDQKRKIGLIKDVEISRRLQKYVAADLGHVNTSSPS